MIAKAGLVEKGALNYTEYRDSLEEANIIANTILNIASVPTSDKFKAFLAAPKVALGTARPPRPNTPPPPPKPFKLNDIVILVRTKLMIPTFENALLMRHIPYYVKDGKSLLQTKEVADLLAYLRLLVNPYDAMSFERAVQVPKRGFGEESIRKLIAQAVEQRAPIVKLASSQAKLLRFETDLMGLTKRFEESPAKVTAHIEWWMEIIQYKKEIQKAARDVEDEARRLENIKRITALMQEIMDGGEITTLHDLLDHITLMQDAGLASSNEEKVHLMTAHSSKGLEYKVVFAPCFFDGAIPHHRSLKYPDELAEEARLVYVIFTRAIEQLRVSRPLYYATRSSGPGKPTMAPTSRSRFLEPVRSLFSDPKNIL
jgi:DNA helicase-2/ATP-dependent DNA helicase PcrA